MTALAIFHHSRYVFLVFCLICGAQACTLGEYTEETSGNENSFHDYLPCVENTTTQTRSLFCPDKEINDTKTDSAALMQALTGAWGALIQEISLANINEHCRHDIRSVWRGARSLQLWALRILDSSAKLPSGLLGGNVNQFGDFDQCLSVSAGAETNVEAERGLRSRYCLLSVDLRLLSAGLQEVDDLLHSHYFIRSDLQDPGHRIARQTELRWGLCLPTGCSARDAEKIVASALTLLAANNIASITVRADPDLCYEDVVRRAPLSFHLALGFILFLMLLTLLASWQDKSGRLTKQGVRVWVRILSAFSLQRNTRLLFEMRPSVRPAEEVQCVHGIRCLNAVGLLILHKAVVLQFLPLLNRTYMAQVLSMPWAVIGRTSIIYTDSFLLLSGFLTALQLTHRISTNSASFSFFKELKSRVFRILPNLVAVVLFCSYVLPFLGSGPQWGLVVEQHSQLCRRYMWRNFLFIHNFFGFSNMCLTHTHQLGIDMQLFTLTPALVLLMCRSPRRGIALLFILAVASTVLRFAVALRYELSTVVHFGATVSQLFRTADMSYTMATNRATIYLMGVALGYFLRCAPGEKLYLSKRQALVGWVVATSLGVLAMCGPVQMGLRGYRFQPLHGAIYTALAPIAWGTFVSWGIVACISGYGGPLGALLEWPGFRIFSRIAYAVYLTQFPIYFYNVGRIRASEHYSIGSLVNGGELTAVLLTSVALTLLVDMPAQRLRNAWRGFPDQAKVKSDLNEPLTYNPLPVSLRPVGGLRRKYG